MNEQPFTSQIRRRALRVDVIGEDEKLLVTISYQLATINHTEQLRFVVEN